MATFSDMVTAIGKGSAIKKNNEYYGGATMPRGYNLEEFAAVLSSQFNRRKESVLKLLRVKEALYYKIGQRR